MHQTLAQICVLHVEKPRERKSLIEIDKVFRFYSLFRWTFFFRVVLCFPVHVKCATFEVATEFN